MTYVGIDNGISGAIAWLDPEPHVLPFKTAEIGGDTYIDPVWLSEILRALKDSVILVEKAQKFTLGRLALCSTWSSWATIKTVLDMEGLSYKAVAPQQWQRIFFRKVEDTKAACISVAQKLFPSVSLLRSPRCKKPDHNLADALLMAEACRRMHRKEQE